MVMPDHHSFHYEAVNVKRSRAPPSVDCSTGKSTANGAEIPQLSGSRMEESTGNAHEL